jgi:hypothetical protein
MYVWEMMCLYLDDVTAGVTDHCGGKSARWAGRSDAQHGCKAGVELAPEACVAAVALLLMSVVYLASCACHAMTVSVAGLLPAAGGWLMPWGRTQDTADLSGVAERVAGLVGGWVGGLCPCWCLPSLFPAAQPQQQAW